MANTFTITRDTETKTFTIERGVGRDGSDASVTLANVRAAVPNMVEVASPAESDFIQRVSGSWVSRTIAQVKTALGLGSAAYVSTSTGGNDAADSGKVPVYGATGELVISDFLRIEKLGGNIALDIITDGLTQGRYIQPQDKDGTIAYTDDAAMTDERVPTAAGLAAKITAATSKATPVDADEIPLADSAASFGLKKATFLQVWTNYIKAKLDAGLTVAGNWAFSSTTRPTSSGTGTPASNSLAIISDLNRERHFAASSFIPSIPYLAATATGGIGQETTNQSVIIGLGTDLNSVGKVSIIDYPLAMGQSGDTVSYAIPFVLSGRVVSQIGNEFVNHRIQVGTNTSVSVPLKGVDPIATENRGIGIEFRKEPGASNLQVRLYARNGYPTVSGTLITSSWSTLGTLAAAFRSTFSYTLEHLPTSSTVNLYVSFVDSNDPSRANRISSTPLLTITGSGVPTDYRYVGTNYSNVLAMTIPDGTNSPAGVDILSVYSHIFEIK